MSKIELTRKWWSANRPKDLKAPELEKALGAVEQAKGAALGAALAVVSAAIAKVAKELDKKTQKELLKNLGALRSLAETEAAKANGPAKAEAESKSKPGEKAKPQPEEAEGEGDETAEEKLFAADFVRSALRQALRKPLNFGFALGTKPEQCAFAVTRTGTGRRLAKLARDRTGSPKACWGQVQADENDPLTLTISLDCPAVAGVARTLRKYLQFQGITLFKKFRVLVEGKEAESDGGADAPEAAEAVQAAGDPQSAAARTTRAAPPATEESSRPPTEQELVVLEDKRRGFKKARAAWVAAKEKAEQDLETVKDGAHMAYMADAVQYPKIVRGCKDIDTILDNLDDELRDTLDKYASTPLRNQAKLHQLAETANEVLDRYQKYVEGSPLMKAVDQKEFADVTIHAPIVKALADLRKALS
jgi:hypothetical protein